ncbi:MAG: O-antigen ligase family protein [Ignavibacterium sp.]|nr:MAG: O-antigen ligase family protein [Ignavibacterium sp.]
MKPKETTVKYIDYTIFFFVVLFLASLTTSIFINQVGYYGAFVFILYRYFYTKENQFFKTGLELPFILLVAAELLSSIFSLNQAQSFHFTKRLLIISTFYVFTVAVQNLDRAKLIFNLFLFFTITSWIVYLFFAYDHYIHGKYLSDTGPPVYQMIITTSELISFTVLLLFAFVINEKANWKYKLIYIAGFCISAIALLATYKKTGWIGTAAGILAILIVKKQWKLIAGCCVVIIGLYFLEKDESRVLEYSLDDSRIELINSFETEGRAYNVFYENDSMVVSDFENGLLVVRNSKVVKNIKLPEAVYEFKKWKSNFYVAHLADKRFILLRKTENELQQIDEFISPGFVRSFMITNDYLYVNDLDSGLTIYRNPFELNDTIRYPMLNKNNVMMVDSTQIFFTSQSNEIKIYELKNYLPTADYFVNYQLDNYTSVNYFNRLIISSNWKGTKVYDIKNNTLNEISNNNNLKAIRLVEESKDNFLMSSLDKNICAVKMDSVGKLKIIAEYSLDYLPISMIFENGKIITTNVVEGRFKRIFDTHHPNNLVRFALWRAGWEIFKDYPIFGVGDIDLGLLYKKYKRYFDKELHGHLHNNYIHILATLGLFGFIAFMFLLIKIFMINNKIYSGVKDIPSASSFALGTIGVFISFLVSGLVEWNYGDHEIITMLWFILGLNVGTYNLVLKQRSHMEREGK